MEYVISTETLITEVEKRPTLWKREHESYKDRSHTVSCWLDICKILRDDFEQLDGEAQTGYMKRVINRWNNVRDSFRKNYQKLSNNSNEIRKYRHFDKLTFLLNTMDFSTENPPPESNDSLFDLTVQTISQGTKRKREKFSKNPHQVFLNGIVPMIQDFTEDETIEFQIDVLQLVKRIKSKRSKKASSSQEPYYQGQQLLYLEDGSVSPSFSISIKSEDEAD